MGILLDGQETPVHSSTIFLQSADGSVLLRLVLQGKLKRTT